jgi:Na+-translocating ferredoxin:NAD+ oxidoreductase RnfG subunit
MSDTVRFPLVLGVVCVAAGIALALTFSATIGKIEQKEAQKRASAVVTAFFDAQPVKSAWANMTMFDLETGQPIDLARRGQEVYMVAYKDSAKTQVLGYATEGQHQGYSSKIVALVGAERLEAGPPSKYRILGMRIINQNETPGLGTQSNQVFSDETIWSRIGSAFGDSKPAEGPEPTPEQKRALGDDVVLRPRAAFEEQFTSKVVTVDAEGVKGLQLEKGIWEQVKRGERRERIAAISGATISSNAAVKAVEDALQKMHKIASRAK